MRDKIYCYSVHDDCYHVIWSVSMMWYQMWRHLMTLSIFWFSWHPIWVCADDVCWAPWLVCFCCHYVPSLSLRSMTRLRYARPSWQSLRSCQVLYNLYILSSLFSERCWGVYVWLLVDGGSFFILLWKIISWLNN